MALTPVRVWPNPCSEVLHVDVAGGAATEVRVRDAIGRTVARSEGAEIPVAGWPAGFYMAELWVRNERIWSARFVKH